MRLRTLLFGEAMRLMHWCLWCRGQGLCLDAAAGVTHLHMHGSFHGSMLIKVPRPAKLTPGSGVCLRLPQA